MRKTIFAAGTRNPPMHVKLASVRYSYPGSPSHNSFELCLPFQRPARLHLYANTFKNGAVSLPRHRILSVLSLSLLPFFNDFFFRLTTNINRRGGKFQGAHLQDN